MAELRRSNPQGWLVDALQATYPEMTSRRAEAVIRLRLKKLEGSNNAWRAVLSDENSDLIFDVIKIKP